jgi:pseudouridine-5'-phosphate glycosidase
MRKKQSVPKEKIQVEKPVPEEKDLPQETPTELEEAEIVAGKEESVTGKDTPVNDNQPYEGSATLKRYIDDSPD